MAEYGPLRNGEHMVHVWAQDLLDDREEAFDGTRSLRRWRPKNKSDKAFDRRGWLSFGWSRPKLVDFRWQLVVYRSWRRWEFGWGFSSGGGDGNRDRSVTVHVGPVGLWLTIESSKLHSLPHESDWHLRLSLNSMESPTLWWSVGQDPFGWHENRRNGRRLTWRERKSGLIDFADLLLGRNTHTKRALDVYDAVIPLPEGRYSVHVTVEEGVWRRPRWPFPKRAIYADIKSETGLPVPYHDDCDFDDGGDNAIFGMGVPAGTPAEVVGRVVEHILADRLRNGRSIGWLPKEKVGG